MPLTRGCETGQPLAATSSAPPFSIISAGAIPPIQHSWACLYEPSKDATMPPPALVRLSSPVKIDRKSTRLNSSHQIISYAVFCLKTKKHTSDLQPPDHLVCLLLL